MANSYASIRRQWRDIELERELGALWRSERFEQDAAVQEALRVYEMAIRIEGWDTVKGWAQRAIAEDRVLNAHLVELAMRALEQGDRGFLEEMTAHLLKNAAPSYFRFWHTLFCTRHTHAGERIFRAQLATLSDFRIVKYRRWLKRILRKLRFRCHSDREKAIGAIVFGMYDKYDAKAYPSELFQAYLACHDAARTRKKTKTGKPVAKAEQMKAFSKAAAELGIWTITEGIRTSAGLSRTRGYLAAMAPKMTDGELMRALRILDATLATADHKRASEEVVALAEYVHQRLRGMDVALAEWCKIYPYQTSPVLVRVFEQLIGEGVVKAGEALAPLTAHAFVPLVPVPLEGRAFRTALVTSYLLYRQHRAAMGFLVDGSHVEALAHPSRLLPYGYGVQPPVFRWQSQPDHPDRTFCELVRRTFPGAAGRRRSGLVSMAPYIEALRFLLYRRAVVDEQASADDVPVLFLTSEPNQEERAALLAHLQMFSSAVLVLFNTPWKEPLDAEHVIHIDVPTEVGGASTRLLALGEQLTAQRAAFADRRADVDRAVRELRLGPAPRVTHIPQGPRRVGWPAAAMSNWQPAAAPAVSGRHAVILDAAGKKKVQVIKTVRQATGRSLADTRKLIDRLPAVLIQDVDHARAADLARKLAAAGARVRVT